MAMSKPSTWKDEVEDELTCSVCLQMFDVDKKIPKMLPRCGHTFCEPCLIKCELALEIWDVKLLCPLCKTANDLEPQGINQMPSRPQGIDGLRNNLVIMSLLNRMEKLKAEEENKIKCASHSLVCEDFCETCQQGLCGECLREIVMNKTHTDHEIVTMADAFVKAKQTVEAQMKEVDDELKKIPLENDGGLDEFNKQFESLRKDNEIAWQKAQKRLNDWKHRIQSTLDKTQKECGSGRRSNFHKKHKNLNAESLKITSRLEKGEFSGVRSSKDFAETASAFVEKIQREEKREFPEVRMDVFNMTGENISIGKIFLNYELEIEDINSHSKKSVLLLPADFDDFDPDDSDLHVLHDLVPMMVTRDCNILDDLDDSRLGPVMIASANFDSDDSNLGPEEYYDYTNSLSQN